MDGEEAERELSGVEHIPLLSFADNFIRAGLQRVSSKTSFTAAFKFFEIDGDSFPYEQ